MYVIAEDRLGCTPNFLSGFNDEAQLAALRLYGDVIAMHRAGKTALRGQGQLLHWRIAGWELVAAH
jgi:hypothetical protein